MKKIPFFLLIFFSLFIFLFTKRVHAETLIQQMRSKQIQQELRNKIQAIEKSKIGSISAKLNRIQIKGTITTISEETLGIKTPKWKSVVVNILESTKLKRRFGGEARLSEFEVGDEVIIVGNKINDNEIDASTIKDLSIQKHNTVFVGEILSLATPSSLVIRTLQREIQTVYMSSSTVYYEANTKITYANLSIGDKIVVKGALWNRVQSKIDASKILLLKAKKNVIGGERDRHGCLGPAGYSWCEKKQKCLRVWEEKC